MGYFGVSPEECRFLTIDYEGKMTIYRLYFDSVSAIEQFLVSSPDVNQKIFISQNSKNASEEFAGPPLDKAIKYCIGGYDEDYTQFLKMVNSLKTITVGKGYSRTVEPSFVGHRPNIPAFLADAPKTMYRNKRVAAKKPVNIYMQVSYDMSTTDAQILSRGISVMNLIQLLEQNGYIVQLKLFEISTVYNEVFRCEIVLKKTAEKLDIRRCYYPICGKAFVRRILLRLKESMPFQENWYLGYGSIANDSFIRKSIDLKPNDIYIGTPREMGIKGVNIYEDADRLLKAINLDKNIIVPNYSKEWNNFENR